MNLVHEILSISRLYSESLKNSGTCDNLSANAKDEKITAQVSKYYSKNSKLLVC